MPVLYYRDPADGSWRPFATTDVVVANEVEIGPTPPEIQPSPQGIEIWIDPAEEATGGDGWFVMDDRFVNESGDAMTGHLTLVGQPVDPLHAAPKQYVDDQINQAIASLDPFPIGMTVPFAGSVAPPKWHLCDGSAHGSAALQAVLGSAYTPDLRGRFVLTASSSYPLRSAGGASSVALSTANMPSHSHGGATGGESVDHTHYVPGQSPTSHWSPQQHQHWLPALHRWSFTGGAHEHTVNINEGTYAADIDGNYVDTVREYQGSVKAVGGTSGGGGHDHAVDIGSQWTDQRGNDHTHQVDIPAQNTHGRSAGHTHGVSAEGGGAGFSIMPSYYVMNHIIYKGA